MLLLDTCTLLWLVDAQTLLSKKAKQALLDNTNNLFISSISALEISLKFKKNLLTLPLAPDRWFAKALELHGISEIPINANIAALSGLLPPHHNDPFDRILVSTAKINHLTIATPDKHIKAYKEIKTIW
ncbi:MAG: type II toxin-antitoxin system VapC family toxin [Gammaproteobacteria bacterium]|nr:type II toxin-antitoxin system VapC family toxin [Gammaproteobacteria bacterium]